MARPKNESIHKSKIAGRRCSSITPEHYNPLPGTNSPPTAFHSKLTGWSKSRLLLRTAKANYRFSYVASWPFSVIGINDGRLGA